MIPVLVLGGSGMLGHKLVQTLGSRFEAWTTIRSREREYARAGLCDPARVISGVDGRRFDSLVSAFAAARPAAVVNCIGIIKQLKASKDPVESLTVNALFPHRLAQLCAASGARLIHISTDCVFDRIAAMPAKHKKNVPMNSASGALSDDTVPILYHRVGSDLTPPR